MRTQTLKQHLVTWLVRQFGRPRGFAGRVAGTVMAHRASNVQRNLWVVSLLGIRPADRVLEIGFGPGVAIAELARHATHGRIYGIDHSAVMVRQASRRNAAAIRAQRVRLQHASVDRLPDFGEPLDVILSVNSLGFWPDPDRHLARLRGLLRPGGRIALASQPRSPGATAETTARMGQELAGRLTEAGYTDARVETLPLDPPVACVLATNPG